MTLPLFRWGRGAAPALPLHRIADRTARHRGYMTPALTRGITLGITRTLTLTLALALTLPQGYRTSPRTFCPPTRPPRAPRSSAVGCLSPPAPRWPTTRRPLLSPLYLRHISPISPQYLPYIFPISSPISPPYLAISRYRRRARSWRGSPSPSPRAGRCPLASSRVYSPRSRPKV